MEKIQFIFSELLYFKKFWNNSCKIFVLYIPYLKIKTATDL